MTTGAALSADGQSAMGAAPIATAAAVMRAAGTATTTASNVVPVADPCNTLEGDFSIRCLRGGEC